MPFALSKEKKNSAMVAILKVVLSLICKYRKSYQHKILIIVIDIA